MICSNCGHSLNTEDKFCPICGNKISLDNIDYKNIASTELNKEDENEKEKTLLMTLWDEENLQKTLPNALKDVIFPKDLDKKSKVIHEEDEGESKNKSVFLFPIISALAACSMLVATYSYEYYVNWNTLSMQKQAETLALSGNIDKSLPLIEEGLSKRPNYDSLQVDFEFLNKGKSIENNLKEVDKLSEEKKFDTALNLLNSVEKTLSNTTGPFYGNLKNQAAVRKISLILEEVKNKMKDKKTIEELIPLYEQVMTIKTEEGKKTLDELRNQISNIAYNNANEYLNKKNFDSALGEINRALQFDKNNKKLNSMSTVIKNQKNKFELDEQKRIEQAVTSAIEEETVNQTKSVKILHSNSAMDNNGNFVIGGEIENIGTKPIYSIEIFYQIYNSKGQTIASCSTFVYPNYLNPGDKGKFEFVHYGMKDAKEIKIINSTWSVE